MSGAFFDGLLRLDNSLLDITLPRLIVSHATLGLFVREVHLTRDIADTLCAVILFVARVARSLAIKLIGAFPFGFGFRRGLLSTCFRHLAKASLSSGIGRDV